MTSKNQTEIAFIDIGSNAVRLILYDISGGRLKKRHAKRVMAGLAKGLDETGVLSPGGRKLAFEALQTFQTHLADMKVIVVATAAVREAQDGSEFVEQVEKILNHPVRILSEEEEARALASGVLASGLGKTSVMGDLGGGSLELIATENGTVVAHHSLPLGVRRIKAETDIGQILDGISEFLNQHQGRDFIASGGSWRALAEAHMAKVKTQEELHGYTLTAEHVSAFCGDMSNMSLEEQAALMSGADRGSEGLTPAARLLLLLVERLHSTSVTFSAFGPREGIILSQIDVPMCVLSGGLDLTQN